MVSCFGSRSFGHLNEKTERNRAKKTFEKFLALCKTSFAPNGLRLNFVAQGGVYINLIDFLNPLPKGSKTEGAKGVLEKKGCF